MAYRCKVNQSKECDGCGSCQEKKQQRETGVIIEATIELKLHVYGELEELIRKGKAKEAEAKAKYLIEDTIECCGLAGEDMSLGEFEFYLDE